MAYARFSSDNWKSDVYTWADVHGGWVTSVAAQRYQFSGENPMPVLVDSSTEAFVEWCQAQRIAIDNAVLVPIDGPSDGDYRAYSSASECAADLEVLRDEGYHVPQDAIDALLGEASEQNLAPTEN